MNLHNIGRVFCLFLLKIYFKIEVVGKENIEKICSGVVLISNHRSYLDPVLLSLYSKRKLYFMAKKELFLVPIFRNIIKLLGAFPVDRNKRDVGAVLEAVEIAKRGDIVAMFPQGHRSKNIEKDVPKTGFFRIAVASKCCILPCSLYYRGYFPRSKIFISYGESVDVFKILEKNRLNENSVDFKEIKNLTKKVWERVIFLHKEQEFKYENPVNFI